MKNKLDYLGALLGRVFVVASPKDINQWNGAIENETGESDYDLLDDHITYEPAGLTSFSKDSNSFFLIFFSMSTKIEIFKTGDGLIILEGLYLNQPLDFS